MKTRRKSVNKKAGKKKMNWQLFTVILIALAGFLLQYLYYHYGGKRDLEQQIPEIDCYYKYFAQDERYEFYVKNDGLVDCKNIWVEEKVFVIVDDEVYEGEDVPHFSYFIFESSRTKMWDLPRGSVRSIGLEKLQRIAFRRLVEKFEAIIISKWLISFSSEASEKRYYFEEYFIHNLEDRMTQKLQVFVGGESILNKIKGYLASGPTQAIRIFDLTEDFELNTPIHYWINKDYSIIPLFSWTKLSIEEINDSLCFAGSLEPQLSDDMKGSIKYIWKYKDGKWLKQTMVGAKSRMVTKVGRTFLAYLVKEDAERVRKNPELIKFMAPNRQPVSKERIKEREQEIREKAREKFLNQHK